MVIEREIAIRTVSESNKHEHWRARHKRSVAQHNAIGYTLRPLVHGLQLPAVVLLTRCAPSSGLDDDNLRGALKHCRDGVAKVLGIDDRDPRVRWEYRQERSPKGRYAVRVRIMAASLEAAS